MISLVDGHQQRRRRALARNIGDQKEQAALPVDQQVIVKIAADDARRLDARIDVDVGPLGKGGKTARQQPHLDRLRGGKLALVALLCLAFAGARSASAARRVPTSIAAERGQQCRPTG